MGHGPPECRGVFLRGRGYLSHGDVVGRIGGGQFVWDGFNSHFEYPEIKRELIGMILINSVCGKSIFTSKIEDLPGDYVTIDLNQLIGR